jgi:DHA2 family multidrug resistance protein
VLQPASHPRPPKPPTLTTPNGGVPADKLDARLLRIAGVCALAALMAIMDTTIVGVAQRTFITEFESTQAVVAWTMTGYTLALATVIPLAGWAADRFGTKRLFMASVLAFTAGSMLCATAPNITLLIAFRVVQGLGGGMLMPLAITTLTRAAGPKRIGRLMAVLGLPMLLGPIAGPILGGWLIDSYGWEWIFGVNVPVGVITFFLTAMVFPPDRSRSSEKFDFVGMLLLSPGLATLLYGVSSIPGHGTVADRHVWIPAAVGLVLIGAFVLHALYRAPHPLIDLRLFQNREVTTANTAMLFFALAFFGAVLLIPSCLQQVLHQTPLQSGVHMIPERFGAMLTMPIAGWLMDRRGPHNIVLAGITLIVAGMATFGYGIANQAHYLPVLLVGLAMMGMGLGCTVMPLTAAAVQALSPHQIARGSALVNVNHQVAGSISTALMSVILTNQFNRSKNISAADKLAILRQEAVRHGVSPNPSAIPRRTLTPDFMSNLLHDLSHAYTAVFLAAVILMVLAYIPAAFLPRHPVVPVSEQTPTPVR